MSALRDKASAMASGEIEPGYVPPSASMDPAATVPAAEPLPDVDVAEPGPDGPDRVPVHVAWSRVMADIRKIGKKDRYDAVGTKYDFRGADRTVNAFGPVLRLHGVLVLPVKVEPSYRDTRTSGNKPTKETTVTVTWVVMGPMGDTLPELQSAGEALDNSDKGTAKAQTVAQRVLLLTAAQVPTGDPDPDSVHVERGEAPVRTPGSYRDEALDGRTSQQRMRQIVFELRQHQMSGATVQNEVGDEEPIEALVVRIGKERFSPAGGEG